VPTWKIYGFPKVILYLERFVLKHTTAHIHKRYGALNRTLQKTQSKLILLKYIS